MKGLTKSLINTYTPIGFSDYLLLTYVYQYRRAHECLREVTSIAKSGISIHMLAAFELRHSFEVRIGFHEYAS